MTRELKDILKSIKEAKAKRRTIMEAYKAELGASKSYQDILSQIEALKTKKAQIEASTRNGMREDIGQSEVLKNFIQGEAQLLSDMAMTKYMKGENIEITDENDVKCEPRITVKFKKR